MGCGGDPLHRRTSQGGEILPTVISCCSRFCGSIMLTSAGSSLPCPGSSMEWARRGAPVRASASSKAGRLPTTMGRQRLWTSGSANALTMTSGPMPQGSPIVMAMTGLSGFAIGPSVRRYSHRFQPQERHAWQPSWKMVNPLHSGHREALSGRCTPFPLIALGWGIPAVSI